MNTFDNKHIFITGATGFVGKVLLEKYLRTFPNIGGIHLLIRPSKKETPQERGMSLFKSACFDRLRNELGTDAFDALVTQKLHFYSGDISDEGLGLPDTIRDELASKIHFVIHSAATLDFTERLDVAVTVNYLGTLRVLALANRAVALGERGATGRFLCFLHVSTCYVNWRKRTDVPEVVYPVGFPVDFTAAEILDCAARGGAPAIARMTKELQDKYEFPNTYTLTKAMAEVALVERAGDVPICIVRPAIIGAAAAEPVPGWVDNVSAVGAVLFFASIGVLHHLCCPEDAVLDIIPVDFVVHDIIKACIVTATAVNISPERPFAALPPGILSTPALGASCREEIRKPIARPAAVTSISGAIGSTVTRKRRVHRPIEGPTVQHFVEDSARSFTDHDGSADGTPAPPLHASGVAARRLGASTLWPASQVPGPTPSMRRGMIWVMHSAATGASRGTTARMLKRYCGAFWATHRPRKTVGNFSFELFSSPLLYAVNFFVTKDFPSYAYQKVMDANPFASPDQRKQAAQLRKAVELAKKCATLMFPFSYETPWVFLIHNNRSSSAALSREVQLALPSDMTSLDHPQYLLDFSWGMHYNVLKEHGPSNHQSISNFSPYSASSKNVRKLQPIHSLNRFVPSSQRTVPPPCTPTADVDRSHTSRILSPGEVLLTRAML